MPAAHPQQRRSNFTDTIDVLLLLGAIAQHSRAPNTPVNPADIDDPAMPVSSPAGTENQSNGQVIPPEADELSQYSTSQNFVLPDRTERATPNEQRANTDFSYTGPQDLPNPSSIPPNHTNTSTPTPAGRTPPLQAFRTRQSQYRHRRHQLRRQSVARDEDVVEVGVSGEADCEWTPYIGRTAAMVLSGGTTDIRPPQYDCSRTIRELRARVQGLEAEVREMREALAARLSSLSASSANVPNAPLLSSLPFRKAAGERVHEADLGEVGDEVRPSLRGGDTDSDCSTPGGLESAGSDEEIDPDLRDEHSPFPLSLGPLTEAHVAADRAPSPLGHRPGTLDHASTHPNPLSTSSNRPATPGLSTITPSINQAMRNEAGHLWLTKALSEGYDIKVVLPMAEKYFSGEKDHKIPGMFADAAERVGRRMQEEEDFEMAMAVNDFEMQQEKLVDEEVERLVAGMRRQQRAEREKGRKVRKSSAEFAEEVEGEIGSQLEGRRVLDDTEKSGEDKESGRKRFESPVSMPSKGKQRAVNLSDQQSDADDENDVPWLPVSGRRQRREQRAMRHFGADGDFYRDLARTFEESSLSDLNQCREPHRLKAKSTILTKPEPEPNPLHPGVLPSEEHVRELVLKQGDRIRNLEAELTAIHPTRRESKAERMDLSGLSSEEYVCELVVKQGERIKSLEAELTATHPSPEEAKPDRMDSSGLPSEEYIRKLVLGQGGHIKSLEAELVATHLTRRELKPNGMHLSGLSSKEYVRELVVKQGERIKRLEAELTAAHPTRKEFKIDHMDLSGLPGEDYVRKLVLEQGERIMSLEAELTEVKVSCCLVSHPSSTH